MTTRFEVLVYMPKTASVTVYRQSEKPLQYIALTNNDAGLHMAISDKPFYLKITYADGEIFTATGW